MMILAISLFLLALIFLWNAERFGAMADLRTDERLTNKVAIWIQKYPMVLGRNMFAWYSGLGVWNQRWLWTQDFWHCCRDMERFLPIQASIAFALGCFSLTLPAWYYVLLAVLVWEIVTPFVEGAAFTWFYHYKYATQPLGNGFDFIKKQFFTFSDKVTQHG